MDAPTHIRFFGSARPFADAIPMRSPVKEPGPVATAMASISVKLSLTDDKTFSIIGKSVCEWVSFISEKELPTVFPSLITAAETGPAEHSIASIFIRFHRPIP